MSTFNLAPFANLNSTFSSLVPVGGVRQTDKRKEEKKPRRVGRPSLINPNRPPLISVILRIMKEFPGGATHPELWARVQDIPEKKYWYKALTSSTQLRQYLNRLRKLEKIKVLPDPSPKKKKGQAYYLYFPGSTIDPQVWVDVGFDKYFEKIKKQRDIIRSAQKKKKRLSPKELKAQREERNAKNKKTYRTGRKSDESLFIMPKREW